MTRMGIFKYCHSWLDGFVKNRYPTKVKALSVITKSYPLIKVTDSLSSPFTPKIFIECDIAILQISNHSNLSSCEKIALNTLSPSGISVSCKRIQCRVAVSASPGMKARNIK